MGDVRRLQIKRRTTVNYIGADTMTIIVNVDVMLARRKRRSKELAEAVGITEQNLSILKTGKAKAIRFSTLDAICKYLSCQPGDVLEFIDDGTTEEEGGENSLIYLAHKK
jgi:putative transcriptional regulator